MKWDYSISGVVEAETWDEAAKAVMPQVALSDAVSDVSFWMMPVTEDKSESAN